MDIVNSKTEASGSTGRESSSASQLFLSFVHRRDNRFPSFIAIDPTHSASNVVAQKVFLRTKPSDTHFRSLNDSYTSH